MRHLRRESRCSITPVHGLSQISPPTNDLGIEHADDANLTLAIGQQRVWVPIRRTYGYADLSELLGEADPDNGLSEYLRARHGTIRTPPWF